MICTLNKEKVFYPKTDGVLILMSFVYIMVMIFGSVLNVVKSDGLETWLTFAQVSLLYLLACAILYILIKSQRIVISNEQVILKIIGLTRHRISFKHIEEVRKAKMNGSPIMQIKTKGQKQFFPLPFLPFQDDWDEIIQTIKDRCGDQVIGELNLKREKGELRTWK